MNKAGFKKCLQDKVVTEPRKCDSDRGGEHRSLEQELDIQQLRRGGRNTQKDNTMKKAERQGSQCWCVQAQAGTQEAPHTCWGRESCHAPIMLMKRKCFRKLLVHYFKHTGFQNTFKINWKLVSKKGWGVGLGKEIQFKIKMRNSAHLLWSPHVPPEMTSLSRSKLCKYTCSLFKCCEGTGSHCSGSAGHHVHRSEHTARTHAPNPYSTPLKEALLLSLLWERKQGSAKSNNLPQWSRDLKLCGLAPKSLCLSPWLLLLKQGLLRRSLRAEGISSSQWVTGGGRFLTLLLEISTKNRNHPALFYTLNERISSPTFHSYVPFIWISFNEGLNWPKSAADKGPVHYSIEMALFALQFNLLLSKNKAICFSRPSGPPLVDSSSYFNGIGVLGSAAGRSLSFLMLLSTDFKPLKKRRNVYYTCHSTSTGNEI